MCVSVCTIGCDLLTENLTDLTRVFRFLTIAYTTLALVPLQFLQCVELGGARVWWFDASVQCYEAAWQKAAFCAVAVLYPVPVVTIVVLQRWAKARAGLSGWRQAVQRVLTSGVRKDRGWWIGVSLLRRLLFVIVYTGVTDRNWRSLGTTVLCLFFVALNLKVAPFENAAAQRLETVSLVVLGVLSASTGPALSRVQYGSRESMSDERALEWVQLVLTVVPVAGFVLAGGVTWVEKRRGEREAKAGCGGLEMAAAERGEERSRRACGAGGWSMAEEDGCWGEAKGEGGCSECQYC